MIAKSLRKWKKFLGTAVVWGVCAAGGEAADNPSAEVRNDVVESSGFLISDDSPGAPVINDLVDQDAGVAAQAGSCGDAACVRRTWASVEYLAWWTSGMHTPPLVTEAVRGNPGVIGAGGQVVYGGEQLLTSTRQGGRLQVGHWFDDCHSWGIEGEYLALGRMGDSFVDSGSPDRNVSRPFINSQTGLPSAELVNYLPPINVPFGGSGALCGMVSVDVSSNFAGGGFRFRRNYACDDHACGGWTLDWMAGYRYLGLSERIGIREQLMSLDPIRPNVAFDILDQFSTRSDFNGVDLGLSYTGRRDRWSLEVLGRLGLGSNHNRVAINGQTTITNTLTGASQTSTVDVPPGVGNYTGGGLLAQRTNIGVHTDDVFSVVPEIGLTLGYQLSPRVKTTFGYNLLVWTNVVRPGNQIDLNVNPDLLPNEINPVTGPLAPVAPNAASTFWAQGLTAGVEIGF